MDGALRRSIERAEGVTTVVGRMGSGKSSLIAAVADSLEEGFLPLRVSVIGVEAGDPAAFARHAITEIRDLPEAQLTRHETHALDRATAEHRTQIEPEGLQLLSQSYIESVTDGQAGDLRRTLAIMRAALDIALGEPTAQRVTRGHVEEGMARTPLVPSSAL